MAPPPTDRRDFLTGQFASPRGEPLTVNGSIERNDAGGAAPKASPTLRLTTRAMACEFAAIFSGDQSTALASASEELEWVHAVENLLSIYRAESEVSRLNAAAAKAPVSVSLPVFSLVEMSRQISIETKGAFDITAGPLVSLWRHCRIEQRVPSETEVASTRDLVGIDQVITDPEAQTIQFARSGVQLDFGGIGKGHALDGMADSIRARGCGDFLVHGGRSSLKAVGQHVDCGGWPVGIGNPLLTDRRLGSIILRDQAMSTSGSNIQHFRLGTRRYGHILDPRTGHPAEGCLSVVALAPSAALADALSTAFYVMGPEATAEYCRSHPDVGAIVIPPPKVGRRVRPEIHGVDRDRLYWDPDQVLSHSRPTG